jgi:L-fuconolactonase
MPKPLTIDAHHHLWRYTAEDFGWLTGPLTPLRRDFLIPDLLTALAEANIDATVAVQARQSLDETYWLLTLAQRTPLIQGVVGWVPIASPTFAQTLETLRQFPALKGLRHVVQAEPDGFLLREDFNAGIRRLQPTGLVYDLLIVERQLPEAIQFVDLHPNQLFILDHIAKPRIAAAELEPWATNLRDLARRPNVVCKLSGLVTEADPQNWTPSQLTPYLDIVTEAFTPQRLLAGSDWPVCLAGVSYSAWFEFLRAHFAAFSQPEQQAIFGGNATAIYRLRQSQAE